MQNKKMGGLIVALILVLAFNVGPFEKYIILALFGVLLLALNFKFRANSRMNSFIIMMWGVLYSVMYIAEGNSVLVGLVYYLLGPLVLYYAVWYLLKGYDFKDQEKKCIGIISMISVAFFLHGLIDVLYSLSHNIFIYNTEYVFDVVTSAKINRTVLGLYLTPMVCIGIPAMFVGKRRVTETYRFATFFMAIVSLLISVYIGNRSLIAIAAIVYIIATVAGFRTNANKKMLIGIPCILLICAIVVWYFNIANIQNFFSTSFLMKRYENNQLGNSRLDVYAEVFGSFTDYILGWVSSKSADASISLSYAHNLWLDCLIYAGILPFVLLLKYGFNVIRNSFKVYRNSENEFVQIVLLCFTMGILANWAVEPVLYADPYYFALCCGCFAGIESLLYS